MNAPRGWGEAATAMPHYTTSYVGHAHGHRLGQGHPIPAGVPVQAHPHHYGGLAPQPSLHVQQLMEQQMQEELRKNAKRAANRRSASTCRARKKVLVETMAEANERMRKRSRVLSLLPDMILAIRRDGVVTYASENCRQFLKYNPEEVEGGNMFDLVDTESHGRLRRLMEENLGAGSKDAIASALRHQGLSIEALVARSELAREQADSTFFAASGESSRPPPATFSVGGSSGPRAAAVARAVNAAFADGVDYASTDGGESEVASIGPTSVGARMAGGSVYGGGSGGSGADSTAFVSGGENRGVKRKALPPLGPAVFSMGKEIGRGNGVGAMAWAAAAAAAAAGGDGGVVTSVDRDLQSKINAYANNRKEMCKLEIIRQDKKSDWYEVRSSMRLVWLKNKQGIVSVEVICSFQRMHTDGPAGSANSIVSRLQRAAAMVRQSLPAACNNGNGDSSQSMSGFSLSGGSSTRDDSSAKSGASSEGDDHVGSGASSSSEYRGGVSSGSGSAGGSGDGSEADNDDNDVHPPARRRPAGATSNNVVVRPPKRARSGFEAASVASFGGCGAGEVVKRQSAGALEGLAAVAAAAAEEEATAAAVAAQGAAEWKRGHNGRTDTNPKPTSAGTGGAPSVHVMAPTARRLAMSAKKTLLLRHHHGFEGPLSELASGRATADGSFKAE